MRTTETIVALLLAAVLCCAASGAPNVEVTKTKSGLTIIDASQSTRALTWSIRGEHEILFGGKVAVCRVANYTGAIAWVEADGKVSILLLPIADDGPPLPTDGLTARVRELARGLPAGERKKVAKIHADLAIKAGEEITSSEALFIERKKKLKDLFPKGTPPDWFAFFSRLNGWLNEIDDYIPEGVDGPAADFADAFRQIAEGLK